jgi:GTP-binding protein Era
MPTPRPPEDPFRSGFVTLVGRPNVGKSTLLNTVLGTKVSIVSDKPQTTRANTRGILDRPGAQIVFVDTPGIYRPRGRLGAHLDHTASEATAGADVVGLVLDATTRVGPGDRMVSSRVPADALVVVNKVDLVSPGTVLQRLAEAAALAPHAERDYWPVSAATGDGVAELVDALAARLPPGPPLYPEGTVTDVPEAFWVAELVREQLLAVLRDEVPHAVATRVTEWEWPRIRCEILVERESQKGIVIGRRGAVLKEVGTAVREQLAPGAYIELFVKVDRDWALHIDRLGY